MVNQKSLDSFVNENNQLAIDLYSKYKSEEGNIFFSPYSISTALAMTYEGAKGKTKEEIQKVLHFPKTAKTRREGFSALYDEINGEDKKYELSTANALWAQKDYQFLKKYFSTVKKHYKGDVTNLDFVHETEPSRHTINKWVEDKTKEKIKDLIPQGGIDQKTRLVLTNAVYFKGNWVKQFDKEKTKEQDFKTGNNIIKAQMMQLTGEGVKFNYTENDTVQMLELPYEGKELSMLVILPRNNLSDLESVISSEKLAEWKNSLVEERVDVYLPRFKFESKYFMVKTLKGMGMNAAFSDDADFSGMTGAKDLCISDVIHQAFVDVNEEGTEAAAATGVIVRKITCIRPNLIKIFRADHPFSFLIQQNSTRNILFMGRVNNPTS